MGTTTTNINFRVDSKLKAEAEEVFRAVGTNMSAALTMFLKHCVDFEGIPFVIRKFGVQYPEWSACGERYIYPDGIPADMRTLEFDGEPDSDDEVWRAYEKYKKELSDE